ncbi:Transcriptional regulatory protein QseF [Thalassoglobus neptunius]|uniref:Transcriptional regulatory protein QseF n=1 Tax=Thalassoglobus neptunius TaxID=1938619 RepID=A0A5C5W8A1_9PLAN|nr:sigma-54 dependent transcriptional regulator [Thalassoglobus neptunius]TWT46950.1 Transcriptional regulatory protein QseF [Thalassoglobus neptunius]
MAASDEYKKTERILIADDEPLFLRTTGELLRKSGFECVCVPDAKSAMAELETGDFDLVLSDLNMPGNLKLELLRKHSDLQPEIPLIVITGVPTLPSAIESVRLGIADYLVKPVKFEDLLNSVKKALANSRRTQTRSSRGRAKTAEKSNRIIGECSQLRELLEIINRIATTDANVLITGESGTGKEVIAREIHDRSHRSGGKFQVIDCTSVLEALFESMLFGHKKGAFTGAVSDAEGLLKQCDGGTAFFDELGELPAPLQAKLLRAVQEQTFTPVGSHTPVTVNTRFVCATNRDLELEVASGRFRRDLYYRLGVIHLELPPLRDRGDDVLLLANHFLEELRPEDSSPLRMTEESQNALMTYSWPGNIRELRNVMDRAIALCTTEEVTLADLPERLRSQEQTESVVLNAEQGPEASIVPVESESESAEVPTREEAIEQAEYQYLVGLLKACSGNVSEAARQANLSRQGLHKLLNKHNLRAAEFRNRVEKKQD